MEGDKLNLKAIARKQLKLNGKTYDYYSLKALEEKGYDIKPLPYSIKVLLESVLRQCDGHVIKEEHIISLAKWLQGQNKETEVPFKPARVILQDFTGVPAVLDLASMRCAMVGDDENGKSATRDTAGPDRINPEVPVDLVIDHSVQVD
ncbi:MAG: hypothetical protein GX306_13650, partial [Clostridiales bacterium]|nr:hypothetical protein [Clostridiales bacterium]